MPRKAVHLTTSAAAGYWYATLKSGALAEPERSLEAFGGILGGLIGGRLPDRIEPPDWPGHRGPAHSFAAAGALVGLSRAKLDHCQSTLRRWETEYRAKAAAAPDGSAEALGWSFLAALCSLLAGILAGIVAGYITHLGLDAMTPSGIRFV